uniref:Exonuclease n=1 Tax=Siphoviridae sp. ctMgg26 TaxID=2825462 RepID=A0A8S5Q0C3_9CAUD|nr:MAG TPA: Exonuclease [Siphoviridae sp. ctMgg26]
MMNTRKLEKLAFDFKELQRAAEQIAAQMDEIKENIKNAMGNNEQIVAGAYKITNKTVISHRLDTNALKRERPEIASQYTKETTATRFTIN